MAPIIDKEALRSRWVDDPRYRTILDTINAFMDEHNGPFTDANRAKLGLDAPDVEEALRKGITPGYYEDCIHLEKKFGNLLETIPKVDDEEGLIDLRGLHDAAIGRHHWRGMIFNRADFSYSELIHAGIIYFSECHGCRFHDMKGDPWNFNFLFFDCDFKNTKFRPGIFDGNLFRNCTFEKCGFAKCSFLTLFENCTFDSCNFRGASLLCAISVDCTFRKCKFQNSFIESNFRNDFMGWERVRTVLEDCNFTGARMVN